MVPFWTPRLFVQHVMFSYKLHWPISLAEKVRSWLGEGWRENNEDKGTTGSHWTKVFGSACEGRAGRQRVSQRVSWTQHAKMMSWPATEERTGTQQNGEKEQQSFQSFRETLASWRVWPFAHWFTDVTFITVWLWLSNGGKNCTPSRVEEISSPQKKTETSGSRKNWNHWTKLSGTNRSKFVDWRRIWKMTPRRRQSWTSRSRLVCFDLLILSHLLRHKRIWGGGGVFFPQNVFAARSLCSLALHLVVAVCVLSCESSSQFSKVCEDWSFSMSLHINLDLGADATWRMLLTFLCCTDRKSQRKLNGIKKLSTQTTNRFTRWRNRKTLCRTNESKSQQRDWKLFIFQFFPCS